MTTRFRRALMASALIALAPGLVAAQDPLPVPAPRPAPAPLAPPAPPAPPAPTIVAEPMIDERELARIVEDAKRMAEDAKRLSKEAVLNFKYDTKLNFDFDKMNLEFADLGKQFAELRQFPIPPVPPVPPRVGRNPKDPRERQRKIPEGWVETTEPYGRKFPVTKASVLLLVNISGNIEVTPGTGDQIEVQAMKRVWAPNAEEGKKRLVDVTVEAYTTGNRVELRVEHNPRRNTGGVDVEFLIKVPGDGSVDLRSVSGDIRVTNVKGEVRAQIGGNGNLALEGTPRVALAKTVGGDIQITSAGADTQLSLSTVGGNILAQTLNARILDLNSIRGDVKLTGWTGDRANLRTLEGDLDLTASLVKGGRYEIESHSGDIRLSLPEQPGFELEANTYNGRIRVDFSIRSEGPIRDQERGPRFIRGTYGDGGSSLRVQTFSGDIVVTRR